ncbi:hypothetical protein I302_105831 [Kwoniella bestiolae CBS 10118]|uniref:Uncharacterized protein n=1 Tax=Kwoniella bestiolae CBS 10118 TaxID=1296100 RepID=A0A1B9G297_9TREE|nr:hypothetical protein I302_04953 [Kwoniella bestiolae CBS 10118]OCF25143.1 hypothetical protein I302_04953 [Kwoniella bestiolae CBS 10118]
MKRDDLNLLSQQITHLTHILNPSSPPPQTPYTPPTPPQSPHRLSILVSLLPSRFRSLKRRGKYSTIDEKPVLGDRRGSSDSERTLVPHEIDSKLTKYLSAEEILRYLARPISDLQKTSNKLYHSQNTNQKLKPKEKQDLILMFRDLCSRLLDLLDSLRIPMDKEGKNIFDDPSDSNDDGEDEMRNLMIQALTKKINIELNRFSSQTQTHTLNPKTHKNPFVLHSTSLTAPASLYTSSESGYDSEILVSPAICQGRDSLSTPRPIQLTHSISNNSFPSFTSSDSDKTCISTGASPSNWAQNLIRLGSYQASWLFSNTPVAVKKLTGDNEEKRTLI